MTTAKHGMTGSREVVQFPQIVSFFERPRDGPLPSWGRAGPPGVGQGTRDTGTVLAPALHTHRHCTGTSGGHADAGTCCIWCGFHSHLSRPAPRLSKHGPASVKVRKHGVAVFAQWCVCAVLRPHRENHGLWVRISCRIKPRPRKGCEWWLHTHWGSGISPGSTPSA